MLLQHLLRNRTCDAERFWSTLQGLDQQPNEITIDDLFSIARSATLKSERRVTRDRRIGHRVAARNFRRRLRTGCRKNRDTARSHVPVASTS